MAVIVGQGISVSPVADAELSHESTSTVQNKVVTDAIASEYSTSKTYSVGDVCTHDGKLYECIVDIPTAEGWTLSHWKVSNLGDNVSNLNRHLNDETTGLDTKAPVIINTASGAIASFSDGADSMPIKKLVAQIEPVQDLHGQESPYPAGGGKNKLKTGGLVQGAPSDTTFGNATKRTFTVGTFVTNLTPNNYYQPNRVTQVSVAENAISVTTDAASYALALPMTGLTVGAVYVVSAVKTNGVIVASFYKEDGTFISNTVENPTNFTVPAETYYTLIHFNPTASGTQATYTDIQLELGSSPTSYAPYENICPISGWTGAEIGQAGVNVWDEEMEVGMINDDGTNGIDTDRLRTKNYIKVLPGSTYYASLPGSNVLFPFYYDKFKNFVSDASFLSGVFTIPDNCEFMRFHLQRSYGTTYNHDISINYPATDTTYHPYTGDQISVTFPDTIYGGEDEVISGNGTSTMGKIVFDGTQSILATNWQPKENSVAWCYYYDLTNHVVPATLSDAPTFLASSCPVVSTGEAIIGYHPQLLEVSCYNASSSIGVIFRTTDMTLTTARAINAYLAENPVTLVYELATPTTFIHDPQQIDTLYGTNNIWSSTGDVEVTYPADTKLYIDNKITQAIANALNS